jgi:hypothetical protein
MAKDLASTFLKEMIKSGINKVLVSPGIKPLPKGGGSMIQRERNRRPPPKTFVSASSVPKRGGFIFKDFNEFLPKYTARTYRNFHDPTIPVGPFSQISRRY